MDITDEQNKSSNAALTPSSQCVSSAPSDHVIPQMVITSADDTSEDQKNVSECTLVLVPPESSISADKNDLQNGSSNIPSEKPDVDFEDISVVVKDVISKCTDTVSHSIRQRPLVIEVKSVQQQQQDDSSSKCPPPPPPPPPPAPSPVPSVASVITTPPSASQRPLVFESAVAKSEIPATVDSERISPVAESAKIEDELNFDLALHEIEEPISGVPPEGSSPTKKESLSGVKKFFDSLWHTETQDGVPEAGELAASKETGVSPETSKSDSSNIKKFLRSKSQSPKIESPVNKNEPMLSSEALSEKESTSFAKDTKHSIKSFFDSFKHEPSDQTDLAKVKEIQPELIPQSSTPESPKEGKESTSFVKDTKQNIKTFFDSFKHESDGTQTKSKDIQLDISKEVTEKIPQSSPPESPKEGKESTSFVKDTKQNIKTFFDSFKHESDGTQTKSKDVQLDISKDVQLDISKDVSEKIPQSSPPESPKEGKESTSFVKDTKQNIKTFFDSFKHESDGTQTKSKDIQLDISKDVSEKIPQSSPPESPKEAKESTSFVKDTKQNIKTFFDSFKHESDQKKNVGTYKKSASQPDFGQESKDIDISVQDSSVISKDKEIKDTKESKSFAKDTRQNIKSFFETFKHEPSEQKHKISESKMSSSVPDFSPESEGIQLTLKELPDTSKEKEKSKEIKESVSFAKDTKQNIKSFFKHEPSSQKQKEPTCKKSASQPDFGQGTKASEVPLQGLPDISKEKESSVIKDAKQNRKSFFDSFKHDLSTSKSKDVAKKPSDSESPATSEFIQDSEIAKSSEDTKEPSSFAKDARQNIKTFFDTFKHDSAEKHKEVSPKKPALSESDLFKDSVEDTQIQTKDAKRPLRKFFSFKHGEDANAADSAVGVEMPSDKEGKSKPGKVAKSVKLDLNIQYSLNGAENNSKKFGSYTHMNGHEDEIISEVKERAQSVPSEIPRKSKSFGILSREPKSTENTSPSVSSPDISAEQQKEGRHGIKKFFDSFKHEKSDAEKQVEHKSEKDKSQSILETDETKRTEKPAKEKKGKSIKRSLSDKVSREEVVQNFKGFFDSISHKTPSKKSLKDSDHIYDTVEVRPEFSGSVPVIQVSEQTYEPVTTSSAKKESQGMKKMFSSFHSKESLSKSVSDSSQSGPEKFDTSFGGSAKDVSGEPVTTASTKKESQGMKKLFSSFHSKESLSKSVPDSSPSDQEKVDASFGESGTKVSEAQKSVDLSQPAVAESSISFKTEKSDISGKTDEPTKADKTSMFNSIGENILALKDKVLHVKEKRKSQIIEDSVKIEPVAPKVESSPAESSLKATTDVPPQEESRKDDIRIKPVVPEKPKKKEAPKVKSPEAVNKAKLSKSGTTDSPSTLYDTCCMKIAVLLRDKALDIVSEHTKSPPPKPPKPSAETIARARAAAVARRLDAQRRGLSVGEGVPLGCDGMRFVDDETESSCDYKDVENFDYIMDYELINRYKLDSSKFDTFSVPSTCSGLTSFYTADNVTLKDEVFSEAGLETVSLSSDISYNFKYITSTSKSEPKLASSVSNKDLKKGITDIVPTSKESTVLKQTTIKKVPPPIPPKPDISKLRTKSDVNKVSQCVNGLSLSPRLQNKFSKDPVATQKRPLMVADIKETQFSSLQHPKSKVGPKKPARSFDTILKNESLKNISGVTTEPSKTAPAPPPTKQASQTISTSEDGTKTLTKSEDSSNITLEKRTKSPPRPPPPVITKKPTPQRPPPPVRKPKEDASPTNIEEEAIKLEQECDDLEKELSEVKSLVDKTESTVVQRTTLTEKVIENEQTSTASDALLISEENKAGEVLPSSDKLLPQKEPLDSSDLDKHTDELNNNIEMNKEIADSLNNNVTISDEKPKPPPRNRRIRSRTVEVVPSERCEERLKRSQSLSEIDVQKRVTFLNTEKSDVDSKSLYTVVNKEKRLSSDKTAQSSPDLVSCRPLPAPPPPPRRFRSLERKSKTKSTDEKKDVQNESELQAAHSVTPLEDSIKPPSRRRKTDKERFFSLHSEHRKEATEAIKRASSVPSKPDRRIKTEQYDVNANISSFRDNSSNPNIPEFDSTDSLNRSKMGSKSPNPPDRKSSSSWYDASDTLDESWEVVDKSHSPEGVDEEELRQNPKVPARHKSGSKQKSRVTSKFYVNMEEESTPPTESPVLPALVDKETSPLPLDCSEKSVQTSLETLSQGIVSSRDVSHDVSNEDSEDTDELLDLAQTLQKELSTIINRHKSVRDSSEETPSPPLSAAASEKNLAEEQKKISSVRSSTSEVWPLTSSDESDVEAAGETSPNLNEVARKRKEKKIFYIAQEIMTSEEMFVDALKLLNVDFKASVEAASKQRNMSIIPDDALSQILNHLPQLQHLNENLLMELKDRIENWDKTGKIADIIVKMGPFLKLYSWYIHDFESNVSLLEDCKKKYPVFAQVVKEFEMSPRCKRLALNHYMLKPIQRIPQYRLLLQEYLHHLTEDSKDYQDTVTALQIVSEVANHANDSMKHGDNAQKLISIQNSIMGHKEIVKPGRVFVKEGELMKLSRKGMQPRWFVLFNDLLLYLTPVQQGLYRVNHELPLTGMKVAIPIQQDYQNEFSIISVTRSFTLAAKSQDERQEWIIALTKAIEENASKRSTFTNTRLNQRAQDKTSSEEEGAFVLGKKAPVWIPDARVTMCQLCTSEFTVTFRRHHCRACGKVICSICSSHRISLPYLGNRIARVCDECHTHLGQGSSACTESGETDSENQQIAVKSHLRTDKHMKNKKRALPSVLKEVCANDQGSTISGYLHKRIGKSWKRDWFVVKDKVLYEYRASEDVAALRSIPLLGYEIELFTEPYENIDSSLLFQLTHPGQAPITFYADTVGSTERWVSALKTATVLE